MQTQFSKNLSDIKKTKEIWNQKSTTAQLPKEENQSFAKI